jgi:acetylornithine deacetylase
MAKLHDLLAQLIMIDSRNPALAAEGPGEAGIAAAVAMFLRDAGLETTLVEPHPGRPSLIARLRGAGGGRTLLLNAHLDTVGFGAMAAPLAPHIADGRMYGRGSYDMKSGLAAILETAAVLAHGQPLGGDLIVTAVADEEHASLGTQAVLAHLQATGTRVDGAIVTEPTELQICVAHKGFAWVTITTHGRAAHGSRRDEGIDAIAHMGRVLVGLEQLDQALQERPGHPLLGQASLHASLIDGGAELSTYPARCRLQLERRSLPGETAGAIMAEIDDLLRALGAADPQHTADAALTLFRPPMATDSRAEIVAALASAATARLGAAPPIIGAPFWMDAALLTDAGIPTAVFGAHGDGAHADVEWVDLDSVQSCTDVLIATARAFCA